MQAIIPNLAEFIPALISFAIVFFVLSKFAWPAISEMLDQRADNIRESLERAENAKVEAERLLEEYKQTMAEARKEAGTILQQAKQSAESTRSEAYAKAQAEYDDMLVEGPRGHRGREACRHRRAAALGRGPVRCRRRQAHRRGTEQGRPPAG